MKRLRSRIGISFSGAAVAQCMCSCGFISIASSIRITNAVGIIHTIRSSAHGNAHRSRARAAPAAGKNHARCSRQRKVAKCGPCYTYVNKSSNESAANGLSRGPPALPVRNPEMRINCQSDFHRFAHSAHCGRCELPGIASVKALHIRPPGSHALQSSGHVSRRARRAR